MPTIHFLRREAYEDWQEMCLSNGVTLDVPPTYEIPEEEAARLPYTNESFKTEVRKRFGDLRRRQTWENAAISFLAHSVAHSYLEPHEIVTYMVRPSLPSGIPRGEVWNVYCDRVFDEILSFPGVEALIKRGLEQLFRESDRQENQQIAVQFLQRASDRSVPLSLSPSGLRTQGI